MVDNIYFSMYKFNIRRKKTWKKEENYFLFNNIKCDNNTVSVMDILEDIFVKDTFIYDNLRVTEKIEINHDENFLAGILDLGEYGNVRKIFNKESKIFKTDLIETDEVCEPFFFIFIVPLDSKEGFLILEKKKSKPFVSTFFDSFRERINIKYNELIFDFSFVVPIESQEILNESNIKEFIFIKNDRNEERFGDLKIEPKSNKIILNVKDNNLKLKLINNDSIIDHIKQKYIEFSEIKLNVEFDNREKILDIDNLFDNQFFYLEISDKIEFNEGNNPDFESILNLSKKYASTNFSYIIEKRSIFDNDGEN